MKSHKFKSHLWTAVICGLLAFPGCMQRSSASIALPPPERQEVLLTFEDPAELNAWSFNQPKLLTKELSTEWADAGTHAMKVAYEAQYPNWPALMLKRPKPDAKEPVDPKLKRFFELLDSGQYDAVTFTIRNPNDRPVVMQVNSGTFQLPANSVTPMEVSLARLCDAYGGSPDKVPSLNITAIPDQEKFFLYLDNLGFLKRADEKPARVANALALAEAHGRSTKADRFSLGVESPMRHVFLEADQYSPPFESSYAMKAARNESESFQLVVVPFKGDLENVTWTISPPVNTAGAELPTTMRVVGYVRCDPMKSVLNAKGGWYPDLLVDSEMVESVPSGQNLNLWVKVRVPENAAPGSYVGAVTVQAKDAKPQTVAVTMEVWPFALPTRPSLKQAYSLDDGYNGHGLAKIYPKGKVAEMRLKFEDMLLGEYRMDVNSIYRTTPPKHWDAKRLRQLAEMGITGIALGQFPSHPQYYPGTNPDLNARVAEIKEYLKVVDEAGVRNLCYFYGFDEVQDEPGLKRLFEATALLKKHFPDIPFLTTATAYQDCRGALLPGAESVNWWCPLSAVFSGSQGLKNTQQAIANGHGIWWYICNMSPAPEPNFDLDQSPVEARILMGSLAAKYQVMGLLYYALNFWGNNGLPADLAKLPYVEWNPSGISWPERYNGQGILIAAGENGPIPTIRMEMIRDGLEDFDLYAMLRAYGADGAKLAEVPAVMATNIRIHTTDPVLIEAERIRLANEIVKRQQKTPQGGAK